MSFTYEEACLASAAWKRNCGLVVSPERILEHLATMGPDVVTEWRAWIDSGCPIPWTDDAGVARWEREQSQDILFEDFLIVKPERATGRDFPELAPALIGTVLESTTTVSTKSRRSTKNGLSRLESSR
jgi:hypothetical protein